MTKKKTSRAPAKKQAPKKRAATRRNAPRAVAVRTFTSSKGHLVGSDVLAIEYLNVGSSSRKPYRHDFDENGVEIWALRNGSLLLRHPKFRLWDDFNVSDDE